MRSIQHLPPQDAAKAIARNITTGRINFKLKHGIAESYETRKKAVLERLEKANTKYEKFVGISDVQEAHKKVKEAEFIFLEARAKERTVLRRMVETSEKLKHIREKLSHVDYSNPMYLQLASDQHELVNEEGRQKREIEEVEEHERDSFQSLSNAMRESYEQERARVERTKHWSIIGTVIGTIIGMTGSLYMNRTRTKDLMKAVKETRTNEDLNAKLDSLANTTELKEAAVITALNTVSENLSEMSNALQVQNLEVLSGFISNPVSGQSHSAVQTRPQNPSQSSVSMEALIVEVSHYNEALLALTNAVKAFTNSSAFSSGDNSEKLGIMHILDKQAKATTSLQVKLDEMITATNQVHSGVLGQLKAINKKLSNLFVGDNSSSETGPVIDELPLESGENYKKLNWPIGVKDVLLWGSALCCLYLFIKL